jgi:hypothetical protein
MRGNAGPARYFLFSVAILQDSWLHASSLLLPRPHSEFVSASCCALAACAPRLWPRRPQATNTIAKRIPAGKNSLEDIIDHLRMISSDMITSFENEVLASISSAV